MALKRTIGKFSPGNYTMQFLAQANNPGQVEPATAVYSLTGLVEGPRQFRRRPFAQGIRADDHGDTMIDGVYRGGDCFLLSTLKEWILPTSAMAWPWANGYDGNEDMGVVGVPGTRLTDKSFSLILFPAAGTPAETLGPVGSPTTNPGFIAENAILTPDNDVEILFANEQRDVPLLFQLLPYIKDDAGAGTDLLLRHFEWVPASGTTATVPG